MKNNEFHNIKEKPNGKSDRRKFLKGAAAAAGGLVLGMHVARAEGEVVEEVAPAPAPDPAALPETLMNLPEKVFEEVGGFEIVENGDDKIIVARTGPIKVAACSAICTHKGGVLGYDHASGQFVCPLHAARFETTGKVAKGPATRDLKSYKSRVVLGLSEDVEEPK